jgi:TolB-like protein
MRPGEKSRGNWREQTIRFLVSARKKIICIFLAFLTIFLVVFYVVPSVLDDSDDKRYEDAHTGSKSLLVLPFKNMNSNRDYQYFVDGITENLVNTFFMLSGLKVIPRSTAEHFTGEKMNFPEIAGSLKVRYILDGNVLREGNSVRIIVDLLDVVKNQHILSEKITGDVSEIFILQSEIVKVVAEKLNISPTYDDIQLIEKIPTQVSVAYDYYLKARFLFSKAGFIQQANIDNESLDSSLVYYQKAVSADTTFAGAYAGLANVWFAKGSWERSGRFEEKIIKSEEFTKKALEIDPYCAEAHAVKGSYLIWPKRSYEAGRFELLISHQLNPNYPVVDLQYIHLLLITGPIDKARLYVDQAMEREPYSWILHNLNSWVYYFEEKYTESVNACKIAIDFNPGYIFNNWLLFLNYTRTGKGEAAVKELQIIANMAYESAIYDNAIQDAFYQSGIKGLFLWLTDQNLKKPCNITGLDGDPFFLSWWFAILGDRNKSLDYLEKSLDYPADFIYSISISTNPDFDIIRKEPRFLAFADRLGLSQYNYRKAKPDYIQASFSK